MVIYKNDDIEKWNEIMASDVAGTRFYVINPKTGEEDLGFEFQRKVTDIFKEIGVCAAEMFNYVWDVQETFSKMEDVHTTIIKRYDLSKREIQDMLVYLHLNLPKNEKGYATPLTKWKKYRDRDSIYTAFVGDTNRHQQSAYSDAYLMKSIITKGKINMSAMFDFGNLAKFRDITENCHPVSKF